MTRDGDSDMPMEWLVDDVECKSIISSKLVCLFRPKCPPLRIIIYISHFYILIQRGGSNK